MRLDPKTKSPNPDSLLYVEATFLMKLKNMRVETSGGQRSLSLNEIREIFRTVSKAAQAVSPDAKEYGRRVAACYALKKTDWARQKQLKALTLRPMPGHEEIKAPKCDGRSRFSRPALRLIRALFLSGQSLPCFERD